MSAVQVETFLCLWLSSFPKIPIRPSTLFLGVIPMVKFSSVAASVLSLLIATTAPAVVEAAYPNPGACSGVCGNAHDPAIMRRSDGTYFRFSTNGKVAIHTAPSITGPWTYKGAAIPAGSSINLPGRDGLWAPDVQKVGNTYYLYYSVSTFGNKNSAIGVATSTTMDVGSWTDHGSIGVTSGASTSYNAIDGNLLVDGSNMYMTFGSFWTDIYQISMKNPPLTVAAPATTSRQLVYDKAFDSIEAAYLFKSGSFYYLFFSQGQCCGLDTKRPAAGKEYKIKVCRSSSPTGGFVDKAGKSCTQGGGTVVLESHGFVYAPGGQGVYQDPVNGPIVYYHYGTFKGIAIMLWDDIH
jgi:arabinan endo-1,5-alpha-L-arabinosidase